MKTINSILLAGKEVLPIIEGGKGIGVSSGVTSGAFANAGAIGTFSGVNADFYDENGNIAPYIYTTKTRIERQKELIVQSVKGGITQAQIAYEKSCGNGLINMNVLWEMGDVDGVLNGVLEKTKGLIHGVTCGAGMPYKLAEICANHEVHFYPIVSSMRAFRALWKRSYSKFSEFLGAVVYEDPWKAGGHSGISNQDDPNIPVAPFERVLEIRNFLKSVDMAHIPIVIAGGVWCLSEWEEYIGNPDLEPLAFQFGTRPMLTQESPISAEWKRQLSLIKKDDIVLNQFSPTGFYSSAVRNAFLQELIDRNERQVPYGKSQDAEYTQEYRHGNKSFFVSDADKIKADGWAADGFSVPLKTPDDTLVFVSQEKADKIKQAQIDCVGCLSHCKFSGWVQPSSSVKLKPDPRTFCIQNALKRAIHTSDIDHALMFAGTEGHRFATDPFYKNGFVPTVAELVTGIIEGK